MDNKKIRKVFHLFEMNLVQKIFHCNENYIEKFVFEKRGESGSTYFSNYHVESDQSGA